MFHMKLCRVSPLRVLLNFESLLQLTAGSVDVVAPRITNRGLDAARLKATLKILDLMDRRRLERAALDIVKLNQVNVTERSLTEVAECLHFGVRVVDALDHGVFISWAATRLLGVELQCLMQTQQRVLFNARHEFIARGLDGGVQRNGERKLLGNVSKFADAGNNAAGGDGKVARTNADTVGVVEDS